MRTSAYTYMSCDVAARLRVARNLRRWRLGFMALATVTGGAAVGLATHTGPGDYLVPFVVLGVACAWSVNGALAVQRREGRS